MSVMVRKICGGEDDEYEKDVESQQTGLYRFI